MTTPTPEERIKELARLRAIDSDAADRLLAAVRSEPVRRTSLWNPLERYRAGSCVIVAVLASFASLGASRLGLRYAGFLDQHAAAGPIGWKTAIADQLGAFPLGALVFWIVGFALARRTRIIDMFATVGVARIPVVIFSLPLALLVVRPPSESFSSGPSIAAACFAIIGLGLQITCLVFGFRTATGLRGAKLTLGFIGALALAEAMSLALVAYR